MSADLVNPVLRGFFPDPSLVRVGDWFYVATSSFQWFPTIPVHRSRDLRTWEYAGAVDVAAPGRTLAGVPDSGGIWAPALSHDGDRFWLTYAIVRSVGGPTFDLTAHVTTAPSVAGPWSEPVAVPSHGFDPSLFHEDGRHWLLNLQNDTRPGGQRFGGVVLRELVLDGVAPAPGGVAPSGAPGGGMPDGAAPLPLRATGPTWLLWQQPELIEGPKVVRHDGWYYLVLAEGGTGYEHGVRVARSRVLTGPYEIDPEPLMTTRRDPGSPLQKCGHAELVECADGSWVASFLTARPVGTAAGPRSVLGRETGIEAIVWRDGWPRLAAGGTRPRVVVPAVELPAVDPVPTEVPAPLSSAWPWSTLRAPAGDWLQDDGDGTVRLRGRNELESLFEVSLLARRVPEHEVAAAVTVDADPTSFTQSAGLTVIYQADAAVTAHVTWAEPEGEPQRGQQWVEDRGALASGRRVVALVERLPGSRRTTAVREVSDGGVRLEVRTSPREVSFAVDGVPLGPSLDVTALSDDAGGLRFTGLMVGVSAHDVVDGALEATFSDWAWRTAEVEVSGA